jgi:L-ribulose-5-phosphate 3-epimerase
MIKSINLWSFPGDYKIKQCIEKAVSAHFAAIEPNISLDGELRFESPDSVFIHVKQMAEYHGLAIASLSTGVFWTVPPTHDNPSVRAQALDLIKRQLEAASLIGAGAILVVPGLVGAEFIKGSSVVPYDIAIGRAQEFLAAAEPYARLCGVVIGVENVWNKMLISPLEMRDFIDSFASPYVQAYFDIGNVLLTGYPEHWIRILGKRIARVHIKDFKLSVGNINGFTDLLAGDVNFLEVIKALAEVPYEGFVTAEMNAYQQFADQAVDNASTALDRIFAMK